MSDDMTLRIKLSELATSGLGVGEREPLGVTLSGVLVGPVDTLIPLLRAQHAGRPVITITLEREEPADARATEPG